MPRSSAAVLLRRRVANSSRSISSVIPPARRCSAVASGKFGGTAAWVMPISPAGAEPNLEQRLVAAQVNQVAEAEVGEEVELLEVGPRQRDRGRVEGRGRREGHAIPLAVEERVDHRGGDLVAQLGGADGVRVDQDVHFRDRIGAEWSLNDAQQRLAGPLPARAGAPARRGPARRERGPRRARDRRGAGRRGASRAARPRGANRRGATARRRRRAPTRRDRAVAREPAPPLTASRAATPATPARPNTATGPTVSASGPASAAPSAAPTAIAGREPRERLGQRSRRRRRSTSE